MERTMNDAERQAVKDVLDRQIREGPRYDLLQEMLEEARSLMFYIESFLRCGDPDPNDFGADRARYQRFTADELAELAYKFAKMPRGEKRRDDTKEEDVEGNLKTLLEELNASLTLGGEAYFALRQETDPNRAADRAGAIIEQSREIATIAKQIQGLGTEESAWEAA